MSEPFPQPIYVTRPYLPPLAEFCEGLREIWDNAWLTNSGPVLRRYTCRLEEFMGSGNVCLFTNGTLALQIALQGMGLCGEVITTPFTFVATTHALYWNQLRPVFVDIEPDYYTLDPERVEAAITPHTTAILAVHVFGYPCQLDALADIARRHNLKLIYDAAHAFGVEVDGRPLGQYGDLSMYSFHATKIYHSIEGGMLVFADPNMKATFDYLKNFGFENEIEVVMPGTNAKMNELQALMGLQILDHLPELIARRGLIHDTYRRRLSEVPGIRLPRVPAPNVQHNYAYYPIEVDAAAFGLDRDGLYTWLRKHNVIARRYFYPLVCDFACYRGVVVEDALTVSRDVASRILTLPIYYGLSLADVNKICDVIMEGQVTT